MILYGLKNCDTCRNAMKALNAAGRDVRFHDVRADGLSSSQLSRWAKAAGWEALLNTRSTTWRRLSEADKKDLNEKKSLALMAAHPALIKRPVIEYKNKVHVGWTKDIQDALLT